MSNVTNPNLVISSMTDAAQTNALYTVHEVRSILKIGNTKCWELIGNGDLEVIRLGARCTRITGLSINLLVESGLTSTRISASAKLSRKHSALKSRGL